MQGQPLLHSASTPRGGRSSLKAARFIGCFHERTTYPCLLTVQAAYPPESPALTMAGNAESQGLNTLGWELCIPAETPAGWLLIPSSQDTWCRAAAGLGLGIPRGLPEDTNAARWVSVPLHQLQTLQ